MQGTSDGLCRAFRLQTKYIFYNTLAPAKYASVGREYRYSLPEAMKP